MCFFRGQGNPDEKVPNCGGESIPEADYCYEPDKAATLEVSSELDRRILECGSGGKICMQCQGGMCLFVFVSEEWPSCMLVAYILTQVGSIPYRKIVTATRIVMVH
jgi:hypothetical protein